MASEPRRYDRHRSYLWNFRHAPDAESEATEVAVPGDWDFCGRKVASPLGVAAGPLLNGAWCLHYARLGFDVVTYKTVRAVARDCYRLPNLQPVRCSPLRGGESHLPAVDEMTGSWAVSFGMPSKSPRRWREDVRQTRDRLPSNKVLVVSTVGTVRPGWTIDDLARDYARCVRWAIDSGADAVEVNFSCPNVDTRDGQLYQQAEAASLVAQHARQAAGSTPLIVKIGHLPDPEACEAMLEAIGPHATALSMTNSIAATVVSSDGKPMFSGSPRGICGKAILEESLRQVQRVADSVRRREWPVRLIGVGGASTADDVRRYLEAGAHSVHMATAPMIDPLVGIRIRRELRATIGSVPTSSPAGRASPDRAPSTRRARTDRSR